VEDRQVVRGAAPCGRERRLAVADGVDLEPLAAERVAHALDEVRLVVGEEDPSAHAASGRAAARVTRTTVPRCGAESTSIVPPSACTASRTIARPSPNPSWRPLPLW